MLKLRTSFALPFPVLISLAVGVCEPVFAADFAPIYKETILPHEGGYTCDRRDPGNWTGGKVGKGKLLGTNRGIAATTYGVELLAKGKTIRGLTNADCAALYERDYFRRLNLHLLKSQGIASEITDEVVNMGEGGGRILLQRMDKDIEWATYGLVPRPRVGFTPEYMNFLNDWTRDRGHRRAYYNGLRIKRVAYYVDLLKRRPGMRPFFFSWIARTVD